jgi:hypothetical protein
VGSSGLSRPRPRSRPGWVGDKSVNVNAPAPAPEWVGGGTPKTCRNQ